jgi:ribosomal protein S18 acetylase RimI-like enzyme
METMAPAWGVRAAGIVGLEVWGEQRRQGLATFLLGEAIRQMHAQGVALAEVQVAADNESAVALFQKLGFNEVDQAVHYRKP